MAPWRDLAHLYAYLNNLGEANCQLLLSIFYSSLEPAGIGFPLAAGLDQLASTSLSDDNDCCEHAAMLLNCVVHLIKIVDVFSPTSRRNSGHVSGHGYSSSVVRDCFYVSEEVADTNSNLSNGISLCLTRAPKSLDRCRGTRAVVRFPRVMYIPRTKSTRM
jgi:hypothetical protein